MAQMNLQYFNPAPATIMHVDINSCFATIEQQARPHLRGKPVVVAAYATDHGCILAASREAKKLGVTTGMRVAQGRSRVLGLVVLPPDPNKYRYVNRQLKTILSSYTPNLSVESIDEMVMDLAGTPSVANSQYSHDAPLQAMIETGKEIKKRVTKEIGDWITVSIGIAPNRYLAKVASGIKKPDGLEVITRENREDVFGDMSLGDLCGIKEGSIKRLYTVGITTPLAFCRADPDTLRRAMRSIVGQYWWLRLHGWEDGSMYKAFFYGQKDTDEQKSFGQSHALGEAFLPTDEALKQVLCQLVIKMARRLRTAGYTARGVSVSCLFDDHGHWGLGQKQSVSLFVDSDFYQIADKLLSRAPAYPVRILAVGCYDLVRDLYAQSSFFPEDDKKRRITQAIDAVHDRFGNNIVTPGRLLALKRKVMDRIAFGKVRDLDRTL